MTSCSLSGLPRNSSVPFRPATHFFSPFPTTLTLGSAPVVPLSRSARPVVKIWRFLRAAQAGRFCRGRARKHSRARRSHFSASLDQMQRCRAFMEFYSERTQEIGSCAASARVAVKKKCVCVCLSLSLSVSAFRVPPPPPPQAPAASERRRRAEAAGWRSRGEVSGSGRESPAGRGLCRARVDGTVECRSSAGDAAMPCFRLQGPVHLAVTQKYRSEGPPSG